MKHVGGYELLREIDRGETGTIWMGRRAGKGGVAKIAAVKLLSRESCATPRVREMFMATVRLAMLLNFRNVVQVFDAGEDEGQCYLVMEWVDGVSVAMLSGLVRSRAGTFSHTEAAYIVGEILRALAYAQTISHEAVSMGMTHGDLSPHGVLVSVSGEVKLFGFGTSLADEAARGREQTPRRLRYKAPEQLRRGAREPAVDLYAAGAILHELLDGRTFRGSIDDADLAGCVREGVVPELRDPSSIPEELDALRRALLQADPSRRVASAKDALELLSRWSGYRDASSELARLCQGCLGVSAPRSRAHPQAAMVPSESGAEKA